MNGAANDVAPISPHSIPCAIAGWPGNSSRLLSASAPPSAITVSAARPGSSACDMIRGRLTDAATITRPVSAADAPISAEKKVCQLETSGVITAAAGSFRGR